MPRPRYKRQPWYYCLDCEFESINKSDASKHTDILHDVMYNLRLERDADGNFIKLS